MNNRSGSIPAKETAVFCAQTALLLKAGIPLYEGLHTLAEEGTEDGRDLMRLISHKVSQTGSLYDAICDLNVFPFYMVQMVHIGEKTGKLEEVLVSLSQHYEREDKLKTSVRSAVMYPLILIVMMAIVVAVLVVAVLPVFSQVLGGLGADVSVSGTGLTVAGNAIGVCFIAFVGILLSAVFTLISLSMTAWGRRGLVLLGAGLPFLRGIYQSIASSRFASVMSMMLSSGHGLDESLELAEDVVTDAVTAQKIAECRKKIASGTSFADALLELDLFSGLHARLIQTGEKAGRLDDVMKQMAVHYEEEIDDKLSSLVSMIEPALVILMSVIIGGILLSVMLPMIGILSSIG